MIREPHSIEQQEEVQQKFQNHAGVIKSQHDIMALEGLGKEIWCEQDAQEYVNQERASWNG